MGGAGFTPAIRGYTCPATYGVHELLVDDMPSNYGKLKQLPAPSLPRKPHERPVICDEMDNLQRSNELWELLNTCTVLSIEQQMFEVSLFVVEVNRLE
jgi:hypothetical protein